ncbi:polycomb group protein Psc-like isoform X2 [Tribolium madens]|uniref:polycomb group protein Psc-like isoform X2 n=1 Tax=Tribolium madens TaxID=41895 RepID=UPI001CF74BD4|nr:polycomb group protein Psc-like isoform X2 [Tribolium madens]
MHRAKKPQITDLNQHLTCKLCKGYFIDATTIIECLHSFCRSCIVKYLETNKYCPVCDVQVHKSKPLLNIRYDKTLQDIVYKLVPRLFQNEVQRRRDFYQTHPEAKPNLEKILENYQHIISPEESISLTMCYYGCKESSRYLRCPAAVTIGHLQKLIRAKYGLFDNHHVDILYNQDCLNSTLTLIDVSYIYSWKRKTPLELTYRIYEYTPKRTEVKEEETSEQTNNNNNWKEVQLRISENGEMSIIQDEASELVNNNNYKPEIVTVVDKKLPELNLIGENSAASTCVTFSSSTTTKTVFSTINSTKCSVSCDSEPPPIEKTLKRKADTPPEPPKKQTILNHSIGIQNLSNNHPLKKHSQINKDDSVFTKPKSVTLSRPGTPKPCYMPKPVITVPKPSTSMGGVTKPPVKTAPIPLPPPPQPTKLIKTKPSTPIGYKTLRDPPKSWNSQIAKANITKPITDPKNIKPAKFFKRRNNLPRYLGNPASGVKPMYPVQLSPEKEKPSGEIKKHSIVKIDPKTLKPISEKAPETTSLSNSSDLKINTSSVSIFNPLKLQNSPKGERKSPKSPLSPKTSKSASPTTKRDKLNLNFTPSNPFIPNLTSPTVSPNQFLYPAGPPGFPSYDPRVMAAYHNLIYGQRMPFPPALTMGKCFELAGPTSPKLGGIPHSPQKIPTEFKKKKESGGKSEKSLQNAVEKLTQKQAKVEEQKTTNGETEPETAATVSAEKDDEKRSA